MLKYALIAVIAYLLGSVSVAVLLTRDALGSDVRKQGSGNAGATNVARVFGLKAGIITLVGDMVKAALSGLAGVLIGGQTGLAVACLACLVGHCWPVYFGFRGGKGVSVAGCIALLLDWRFFLALVAWFAMMAILSRRVSFASCTSAVVYPLLYWHFNRGMSAQLAVCIIMAVIVLILHRGNIARLIRGTEPVFHAKSKDEDKKEN
ncbi:MAG: glycerol-3-phosphate 1-O-acyltransferase PlsY [Butyricicoccus sp.]|nr:glycerol-3-phosphate 1-O-acyltransferase PlsY [Butyricicoccus sp.]